MNKIKLLFAALALMMLSVGLVVGLTSGPNHHNTPCRTNPTALAVANAQGESPCLP
jgi:hypothetical protein